MHTTSKVTPTCCKSYRLIRVFFFFREERERWPSSNLFCGVCLNYIFSFRTQVKIKTHLLGLWSAFKCQPLDDMISLTSNISITLEPNATIVMSGFPITNNSGISSILHIKSLLLSKVKYHLPKNWSGRNICENTIYPFCIRFDTPMIFCVVSKYPKECCNSSHLTIQALA